MTVPFWLLSKAGFGLCRTVHRGRIRVLLEMVFDVAGIAGAVVQIDWVLDSRTSTDAFSTAGLCRANHRRLQIRAISRTKNKQGNPVFLKQLAVGDKNG